MNRWSPFAALLLVGSFACAPVDTGSGSVGPGSDGGPVFSGGGGAADAGGPGAGAGSPDAGPGGTADGGSTGGGGTADAGSTGGGVANGCDGLLPAGIPAPSTAIVPHAAGQACYYFALDQKGAVAGESHSGGDPAATLLNAQWQTFSPAGAAGRQFSAGYDLYGEPDGFEGASRDGTSAAAPTSIVKWSSTGAEQRRTLLSGPGCTSRAFLSRFAGALALGGCEGGGLTAALFDAQGNAISSRVIANQKADAVGVVDAQGRTVVVVPGSAAGLSSAYAARWFDNQLAPLTDWFSLPGSGGGPSLQPLIGGGAAYRAGDDWVASLGSGTPGWTAPPAFLSGHPKNDFRAIRGGRGYARIASYGAKEPRNKIEIYDAAGDHCGTGTFPGEGLAVGQDGTVIATGGDGGCSLSWWTGILR